MNKLFIKDYDRFTPHQFRFFSFIVRFLKHHELRYVFWGRQYSYTKNVVTKKILSIILHRYRRLYGLEMNFKNIGGGIRLIHPWCITINDNAIVGINFTVFKGVTVGEISSGKMKGNPRIGDNVTIFANATVCGDITVGDNAIIAGGSFVDFDVPEGATVVGNPGKIHIKG